MLITSDIEKDMFKQVQYRKFMAEKGFYDGTNKLYSRLYFESCRGIHAITGTGMIFTKDIGHHSCGWFKNPDYEQCYHLSLSFRDVETGSIRTQDQDLAKLWCKMFYQDAIKYLWAEPPTSDQGKYFDVWHYRVFCNQAWEPILPRKEVYTTDFTELGWKSFSDLNFGDFKQK